MTPTVDAASLFLLGLLGTAHCLGMCGPLVLALPGRQGRFASHLAYHAGRIATYATLAALAAGLGAGVRAAAGTTPSAAVLDPVGRVQVALSLLSAALLLGLGLVRIGILPEPAAWAFAGPGRIPGAARVAKSAMSGGRLLSLLGFGLLMGLLPCGLSWAAFARALSAGDPIEGAGLGLAFGLGTLPGLLLLGTGVSALVRRHARLVDVLSGLLLVGMAVAVGVDALAIVGNVDGIAPGVYRYDPAARTESPVGNVLDSWLRIGAQGRN